MKTYAEVVFEGLSPELNDVLIARLAEAGFDGFLEEGNSLKAYQDQQALDLTFLDGLCSDYGCSYRLNQIEEENWNASWESSFSPVVVEDFVAVRADFHEVVKGVEYEIIITPKMSFGTGHHATTWLMMKALRDLHTLQKSTLQKSTLQKSTLQESTLQKSTLQESTLQESTLQRCEVVDYGTGTGILAILAEKMGAGRVLAIDNDPWSIDNATENLARNGSTKIRLELGEIIPGGQQFDIVLANINKHILLAHCQGICDAVKPGGLLLMSGILREDLEDMKMSFGLYLGQPLTVEERNNWLMIAFSKGPAA